VFEETRRRGLLIGKGGLEGNCFRIAPALTVGRSEIDEALALLEEAFATAGAH
jgi:4-aminobutyrate aminotransferase